MKRFNHPMDEVNLIAQIADLKEVDYKNTLVITALVELLVEKGIVTRKEVLDKAQLLEQEFTIGTGITPRPFA
jgi:mannitol/fructose-specific phosphotransferase system IIA component (Ntr-type)